MPIIIANRQTSVADDRNLFEYIDETFSAFIEYRCDEASGNLINSGSDGAAYDLATNGGVGYQAGAGATFAAAGNFYISMDGNNDVASVADLTDIQTKSEGAILLLYQGGVILGTGTIFSLKPEIGQADSFINYRISNGLPVFEFIGTNSADNKTVTIGGTGNGGWNPNADSGQTHLLIMQYTAADGHQIYLDGHRLDNAIALFNNTVVNGNGDLVWWNNIANAGAMSFFARAEYDGAGNFVSSNQNTIGRMEYAALFPSAFTYEEIDELFVRFIGGAPVANGYGLDAIAQILGGAQQTLPQIGTKGIVRCNNRLIEPREQGYCSNPEDTPNNLDAFLLNNYGISTSGYFTSANTQNSVSNVRANKLRDTGAYESDPIPFTGSQAIYHADFNPFTGASNGNNQIAITSLAGGGNSNVTFSTAWWDGVGTTGWRNITPALVPQPLNRIAGGNRKNISWSYWNAGAYLAMATQSVSGDNPALGGGGVHFYAITGAGPTYAGAQMPVVGYVPTNNGARGIQFFRDEVNMVDYAVVVGDTAALGMGLVGEVNNLAVMVRAGNTWVATAGLINFTNIPPGATYVLWAQAVGPDLYLSWWAVGAPGVLPAGAQTLQQYRWNGTNYAYVADVVQPWSGDVAGANKRLIVLWYETEDGGGLVSETIGEAPVAVPRLQAFQRDLVTGTLTPRVNYFALLPPNVQFGRLVRASGTQNRFKDLLPSVNPQI